MASPLKYISYVKSTLFGAKWKVELYDTDFSGDTTEIGTSTPPILTYETQNDKRYSPIKGSSLSVPIIVDSTSIENWLFNDIQEAKEERFYAHLYKFDDNTNTYKIYWIGVLLHDLNEREDAAFPYTYELKFTDGLARLKDFKFLELADPTDPLSYTIQTLNWYLYNCLANTPIYSRINSTDIMYSNSVNFYEYNMVTSGTHWSTNVDPLDETSVYPKAFCNTLSNGQLEAFSYYDILEQILLLFNARIIQANGYFRIISVNNYSNASWKERTYLQNGSFNAQNLVAWDSNINQTNEWASSGTNVWQYFPAFKKGYRKFNTQNANRIYQSSNVFETNNTPQDSSTILGDKVLQYTGSYTCLSTMPFTTAYLSIKVYFRVGNYYLKGGHNIATTWTTNSNDRYLLEIPMISSAFDFSINIICPILPSGTHNTADIIVTDINYLDGVNNFSLVHISGYKWEHISPNFYIEFPVKSDSSILRIYNAETDNNYISYSAINSDSLINSEDLELPESYLGDNDKGLNGSLYTGSKYAPLISIASWKTDGGGDAWDINNLLLIETLSPQKIPNPRYQGNIITNGHPYNRYLYQGSKYLLNGGELNLESMEWSGEWFKIYRDVSDIGVIGGAEIGQQPLGTSEFASLIQGLRGEQRREDYYDTERMIASVTSNISGTITSIECTVLRALNTGDKLIIIPSYSGDIIEIELASDCAIDDTSITIVEQTFVDDIPAGSLIFVPFNKPVLDTLRVNGLAMFDGNISFDGIPTSDPHINGRVYRDGNHNLKISNG